MSKTQPRSSHVHGYTKDKDALVKRLHRIEGQVRGIERMVEEDRYCIDILTQIAAVNTALESGNKKEMAEKTSELLEAVHRFSRTK